MHALREIKRENRIWVWNIEVDLQSQTKSEDQGHGCVLLLSTYISDIFQSLEDVDVEVIPRKIEVCEMSRQFGGTFFIRSFKQMVSTTTETTKEKSLNIAA